MYEAVNVYIYICCSAKLNKGLNLSLFTFQQSTVSSLQIPPIARARLLCPESLTLTGHTMSMTGIELRLHCATVTKKKCRWHWIPTRGFLHGEFRAPEDHAVV